MSGAAIGSPEGGSGRFGTKERRLLRRMLADLRAPVEVAAAVDRRDPHGSALWTLAEELQRNGGGLVRAVALPAEADRAPWLRLRGTAGELVIEGVPSGYLFGALLSDLRELGQAGTGERPDPGSLAAARALAARNGWLELLVAPTCPHGPRWVRWAHRLALTERMAVRTISIPQVWEIAGAIGAQAVPAVVARDGAHQTVWWGADLVGGGPELGRALAAALRQWEADEHGGVAADRGDAAMAGELPGR